MLASFVKKQASIGALWISASEQEIRNAKRIPETPYFAGFGVDSERIILRTQQLATEYRQDIGVDLMQEIQVSVKNPLITRR